MGQTDRQPDAQTDRRTPDRYTQTLLRTVRQQCHTICVKFYRLTSQVQQLTDSLSCMMFAVKIALGVSCFLRGTTSCGEEVLLRANLLAVMRAINTFYS